jgi:hypothetical protein
MWFNSTQREEPYQGLTSPEGRGNTSSLRSRETGGAWLSSARVVRCWVKSRNERNPYSVLPARQGGDSQRTAGDKPEEGGDDVKSSCPLCPGSTACNYGALFRLGFPTAPGLLTLNLAAYDNSPVRSTKSTPSPTSGALTVCQHTVSGSISLPSRGAFHLSLTVLVHYRSPGVFSLGAWSPQLLTRFLVPRSTLDKPSLHLLFAYGAFTLCDCPFQSIQLRRSRL